MARVTTAVLLAMVVTIGGGTGRMAAQTAAPSEVDSLRHPYSRADIDFMTGMIGHHAQAVLIAGWAPTHGASPALLDLCSRIVNGQSDEIKWMQHWLADRHQPVPSGAPMHDMMPDMDMSKTMPGMLSPTQLTQLDSARGPEFDRLFLTDMIHHHTGALIMVKQLMGTPSAAQDPLTFKFVSDINADQTIEIDRMKGMLLPLELGANGP